jgi:hypothetical protein
MVTQGAVKMTQSLKEVAFYYPGHLWRDSDWVKTLLLFFDGVGLLVPEYKQHEPELMSPVLAGPLRDKGLLYYLVADEVVDRASAAQMIEPILNLLSEGVLDKLSREGTAFHTISMSRMGFYGHAELADELLRNLKSRGLAGASKDGVSIPVHPQVRYLILVLLSQILRAKGNALGYDLCPATDMPQIVDALTELLDVPTSASTGHVVAFDLQTVSVDLAAVPLDEVLSFKASHGEDFRAYARSARRFSREVALLSPEDRNKAFIDRQAELDDLASDLK